MCLVLYLGSNKMRSLIAWDEASPCFHVKNDDKDAIKAALHFQKERILYVGSDEGCGCGFMQEYDYMLDPEEIAAKRTNQQHLYNYLATCLQDEKSVELYSCWSGDEELPVEHKQIIELTDLLSDSFFFLERQLTIVKSG